MATAYLRCTRHPAQLAPAPNETVADDATQRAANGPARLWRDACRDCGRRIFVDTDGDGGLIEIELDGRTIHHCPRNDAARVELHREIEELDAPNARGPSMHRRSMGPRPGR